MQISFVILWLKRVADSGMQDDAARLNLRFNNSRFTNSTLNFMGISVVLVTTEDRGSDRGQGEHFEMSYISFVFVMYYKNENIQLDEMCRACDTLGRDAKYRQFCRNE